MRADALLGFRPHSLRKGKLVQSRRALSLSALALFFPLSGYFGQLDEQGVILGLVSAKSDVVPKNLACVHHPATLEGIRKICISGSIWTAPQTLSKSLRYCLTQ